jgi:hypothetical protein
MSEVLHFEALKAGGKNNRIPCDLLLTVTEAGNNRLALCCRFSTEVLDTLRWRTGDKVKFSVELLQDRQVWTFRRFADDVANTLTISGNKSSTTACVKRTVDGQMISKLFPPGKKRQTAMLEDGDKITAVFVVRHEDQE